MCNCKLEKVEGHPNWWQTLVSRDVGGGSCQPDHAFQISILGKIADWMLSTIVRYNSWTEELLVLSKLSIHVTNVLFVDTSRSSHRRPNRFLVYFVYFLFIASVIISTESFLPVCI